MRYILLNNRSVWKGWSTMSKPQIVLFSLGPGSRKLQVFQARLHESNEVASELPLFLSQCPLFCPGVYWPPPSDFASALENGPWQWQSIAAYSGYSGFFAFCDAVETFALQGTNTTAPATGVGLDKALAGYAHWVNTTMIPGCKSSTIFVSWARSDFLFCLVCKSYGYTDERDISCLDTYNTSMTFYTDYSVGNVCLYLHFDLVILLYGALQPGPMISRRRLDWISLHVIHRKLERMLIIRQPWNRQWNWFLCNQPLDFWQEYVKIQIS